MATILTLPGGRRVFFVRTYPRGSGKERRTTLGDYGHLTLDDARQMAIGLVAQVNLGEEPERPGGNRKRKAGSLTVAELSEKYMAEHLRLYGTVAALRTTTSLLKCHLLPRFGHLSAEDVTRAYVQQQHADLGTKKKVMANRMVSVLSAGCQRSKKMGTWPRQRFGCGERWTNCLWPKGSGDICRRRTQQYQYMGGQGLLGRAAPLALMGIEATEVLDQRAGETEEQRAERLSRRKAILDQINETRSNSTSWFEDFFDSKETAHKKNSTDEKLKVLRAQLTDLDNGRSRHGVVLRQASRIQLLLR